MYLKEFLMIFYESSNVLMKKLKQLYFIPSFLKHEVNTTTFH